MINLLLSFDDAYLGHALDLIHSIILYNDVKLNIFVLYKELSLESREIFEKEIDYNIGEVHFIEMDVDDIKLPMYIDHISITTYYRLFAPYILDKDIHRILYLDTDIICNKEGISDLYNMDFEGNIIIGVENMIGKYSTYYNRFFNLNIGLDQNNKYINAGVLLIDLDAYRKFITKNAIVKFITENYKRITMQDQDVINKLFVGKIKIVDNTYNYSINAVDDERVDTDKVFIHYSASAKPWLPKYDSVIKAKPYFRTLKKLDRLDDNLKRIIEEKNIDLDEH